MRKRYTEEQIVTVLKEVEDGASVDDIIRKYGVSRGTYYKWRSKYGGLDKSAARKMKQLEEENRRLKSWP